MKAIGLGEFTIGVVTNPKGGYDVCLYHDGNMISVRYGVCMGDMLLDLEDTILCIQESYEEE